MVQQCALTKLAYLLSKSDRLSSNEIRKLIRAPLRGELTIPPSGHTDHSSSNWNLQETPEALPNMLLQIARLSAPPPVIPTIQVSAPQSSGIAPAISNISGPRPLARSTSISQFAKDATSPWSNTISETASTEAALLPFLVHMAVARDDTDALRFCFDTSSTVVQATTPMVESAQALFSGGSVEVSQSFNLGLSGRGVAGGIVNVLDLASGRTPLHVAGLNGSKRCAILLLESGALVHLRDTLDHTALYYVSKQFRTLQQLTQSLLGCRQLGRGTKTLSTTLYNPVLILEVPMLLSCA